jgi:hypothetical protein
VLCDLAAIRDGRREPHQRLEDAQLGRGQRRPAAGERDLAGGRVALQVADHQPGRQHVRRPALQRTQPREQLVEDERLDQVVVGAGVQAGHPVLRRAFAADHQHRCPGPPAAQLAHHVDARHPGDQPVEHGHRVLVTASV